MSGFLKTLVVLVGCLVFVAAVGAGLIYVRLQHGPISLKFAAALVEHAVASDLGDRTVGIEDIEVIKGSDGDITASLRNVVVSERNGATLLAAPRVNVGISVSALARGRLALRRVDLVQPRVNVFISETGALSVNFQQGGRGADPLPNRSIGQAPAPGSQTTSSPAAANAGNIDLVKALAGASSLARRRENATAFLREIGIKDAVVIVDNRHRKTVWNVPDAQLDLDHKRSRSLISGRANVGALTGPWSIAFNTFEAEQSEVLQLGVTIRDLNPHGLARMSPSLAVFEGLSIPVAADLKLELPISGGVRSAQVEINAGAGTARLPFGGQTSAGIEKAQLTGAYDGGTRRWTFSKVDILSPTARLAMTGALQAADVASNGATQWGFDFRSAGGHIGDPKTGKAVPIDEVALNGVLSPDTSHLAIAQFKYRAGGADIAAAGEVADIDSTPRVGIDGRVGPLSANQVGVAWPAIVAPKAKALFLAHVAKARFPGGNFRLQTPPPSRSDPNAPIETRLSATFEVTGLELTAAKSLPPLEVPRALVRIEGRTIEITAPDANLNAGEQRRLGLRGVRFTAVETAAGEQPTAEIAFKVQGSLGALAEIADRDGVQLLKSNGIALQGLDGKLDGQLKLTMPLADNVQSSEVRAEGRVKATDLRLKSGLGPLDLTGGTLNLELSDRVVDIKGDLLIKGVLAKLNWHYILNASADKQPPLRIVATLDTADRVQLGLDLNDVVLGETPLEIIVQRDARGELGAKVRVDLTKAELMIDAIEWKKPPGRAAVFQFDPAKGPGTGAAQRIELQNVKLVGDDVAVEGWMAIGPDNKLREMAFPSFSVNVVTRLDVQGKLRQQDNVWEIKARGAAFDGRDMFRALFNVGQVSNRYIPKDKPGLDLVAEIDTIIGFSDTNLRNARIRASRRNEKLTELDMRGAFANNKRLMATIVAQAQSRQLRAHSEDAGLIFKMVGFYPNAVDGEMKLQVDLDGKGANEKSGVLWAENFHVLGDPIVSEVLQNADSPSNNTANQRKKVVRSRFDFDQMRVPFDVGSGQFVMNNAAIKGPLIGATWRGKVDFTQQTVQMGGTYVPLSSLNSAFGAILGPLTGGVHGEGLLGITFALQGSLQQPQVIVNPLSLVTPGIFRDAFSQMTPDSYKVTPRAATSATPATAAAAPARAARASSSGPAADDKSGDAAVKPKTKSRPKPTATSDWSSETKTPSGKSP